ncbi:hypothetical protein AK812_SmicGene22752 [Symbiodinium microadriaticum]|uniref:Uncharacterized protein n=1 Tax=Symbiodinium microadriaticum TaxID=2951 RepID=A0A1Q9DJ22_SYMMI|nr:hypothetical protein AK812_SmicGene22752 [Symbiodinium microadriaticum]
MASVGCTIFLNKLAAGAQPGFPSELILEVGGRILDSPADGSQMLQKAEEELPLQVVGSNGWKLLIHAE